ncbi:MAG: extracellular solute-binding protein [Oscillospiraceae bacterium]|nr:extracellular solute-binding protein [Oscillospiraceae bacterium]
MDITEATNQSVAYKATSVALGDAFSSNATFKNGLVYYVDHLIMTENDSFNTIISIKVRDEEGNEKLSIPLSEGSLGNVMDNVYVDNSGNISCVFTEGTGYKLLTFSPEGELISEMELNLSSGENLSDFIIDSSGNIFCNLGNCVKVLDSEGNELFTTENTTGTDKINSLIMTGSGVPAAHIILFDDSDNPAKVAEIDMERRDFGAEYPVPYLNNVFSGYGEYLCTSALSTGIYGLRADNLQSEKLIDYLREGMEKPQVRGLSFNEDGTVTITSQESGGKVLYILTPDPDAPVKDRKTITIGSYFSSVLSAAAEFNRTNDEYVIEVISYSDNYNGEGYDAIMERMNTDILAGNIPDIMITGSHMPFDSYARKGLFADLYELIDSDPDLDREDFLPNVLSALETDGKLYGIVPDVSLAAYEGKTEYLGESGSVTIDRANELVSQLPEGARLFSRPTSRSEFVKYAVRYGSFVDYENGSCSFDSSAFIKILETAAADYPDTADFSQYNGNDLEYAVTDNKALLNDIWLNQFAGDMGNYANEKAIIGADISFMGYPTAEEEGAAGAMLDIGGRFTISAKSENKQGAWEFIKSVLTSAVTYDEVKITNYHVSYEEDPATEMRWVNNSGGFPVLTDLLDKLGEQSKISYKTVNEAGELVLQETVSYGSRGLTFYPLTDYEVNKIKQLILSADRVIIYDDSLDNIITEEISYYFGGARSAEETADMIQSRASIYLSEQYR